MNALSPKIVPQKNKVTNDSTSMKDEKSKVREVFETKVPTLDDLQTRGRTSFVPTDVILAPVEAPQTIVVSTSPPSDTSAQSSSSTTNQ